MEGLVMTAQILLSLSILVGLHEMGHLLAAKFFGMRVEKFSIGFPPKIFSFNYKETEYAVSAIPLGGFVKISGMIDESMDKEQMNKPPQPWEFRSKPAWQRLIVMLGGIIVNVITGIVIFFLLTYIYGNQYISNEYVNAYGGIIANELGEEIGLKDGDKIIKINGEKFEAFNDVIDPNVFLKENSYYTIQRENKNLDIQLPSDFIENFNDKESYDRFITPNLPLFILKVNSNSLAERLGLKSEDVIVSLDNESVKNSEDVKNRLKAFSGDTIYAKIAREEQLIVLKATYHKDSILGVALGLPEGYFYNENYGLAQSFVVGTQEAFGIISTQISAFGKMFKGELNIRKSLSGPIGIARAYGGDWQWHRFWKFTAFLSMVLAFMNLLPIPALDGGHVMFLTYEIFSGRTPKDKFLEYAQKIGMFILLSLMVFIIGNDIIKLFN